MIYLDNNATTPIDLEVFDAMEPYMKEEYGNPSSKYYLKAEVAKQAVEKAREQVAALINAKPKEIIFTSGASESNNFIIKGVADFKKYIEDKGNHIITSKVEHKSVLQACKFLNGEVFMNTENTSTFPTTSQKVDRGYEVTFLDVNEYGQVKEDDFKNSLKDNTVLASVIWGNNEIGSLNDIGKLSNICKGKGINFHTDATQVLGKLAINTKDIPVDFMSFSGHKLYGPKGVGASYIRSSKYTMPKLSSLIHGGSQELGFRAGTLSVHNIVGFGKACEIAKKEMEQYIKKITEYERNFRKALENKFENIMFLGDPDNHLPGTISFILPNQFNELYIKKIANDIAFSSGSACSIKEPSYVLTAIGHEAHNKNFFRFSLNKYIVNEVSVDDIIKKLK